MNLAQQIVADFNLSKRVNSKNKHEAADKKYLKARYIDISSAGQKYFGQKKVSHPTKYSPKYKINLENGLNK